MALTRGDVVVVADGKPRPAVIIQSDRFPTSINILICPLTSEPANAPFYRVQIEPSRENGLHATSQLMTDRIGSIRRDRIGGVIGRLSPTDMQRIGNALTLVLDLDANSEAP